MNRKIRCIIFTIFSNALIGNCIGATECFSDYQPATIVEIRPDFYDVTPPYAAFDPCNATVDLRIIKNSTKLMIVMHGGGGATGSERQLAAMLNKEGISTLTFDAFKMNKLFKNNIFWASNVFTGPKQRMLYHSAHSAIKWVKDNVETKNLDIHLYGVSSGATAALNLASLENLPQLKSVFVEGVASMGIGLPNVIRKPVVFIFGKQDNYGGKRIDEYVWKRSVPCSWNIEILNTPEGTSIGCNRFENPNSSIVTLENYLKIQNEAGANITTYYYDGAGHDIFSGGMKSFMFGSSLHATLGANWGVSDKVLKDILTKIKP